mgnify:CR=1 FL=1
MTYSTIRMKKAQEGESQEEYMVARTRTLAETFMWSTILQTSIDFGEKVKVYQKIKNRVASLIPKTVRMRGRTENASFVPYVSLR